MKVKFVLLCCLLFYICLPGCETKKLLIGTFSGKKMNAEFLCPGQGVMFFSISCGKEFLNQFDITGKIVISHDNKILKSREIVGCRGYDLASGLRMPVRLLKYKDDDFVGEWGMKKGSKYQLMLNLDQDVNTISVWLQFEDVSPQLWLWIKRVIKVDERYGVWPLKKVF